MQCTYLGMWIQDFTGDWCWVGVCSLQQKCRPWLKLFGEKIVKYSYITEKVKENEVNCHFLEIENIQIRPIGILVEKLLVKPDPSIGICFRCLCMLILNSNNFSVDVWKKCGFGVWSLSAVIVRNYEEILIQSFIVNTCKIRCLCINLLTGDTLVFEDDWSI